MASPSFGTVLFWYYTNHQGQTLPSPSGFQLTEETAKVLSEPNPCTPSTSGTILFADDEPLLRDVASQMIQKLGFKVLTASTGREAIRLFQEHRNTICVVILDMMMPDCNGVETFNKLQATDPNVRILICSGFTREIMPELLAKGCKGFIQKPFTMADLKFHILKAMDEPIPAV